MHPVHLFISYQYGSGIDKHEAKLALMEPKSMTVVRIKTEGLACQRIACWSWD